MAAYTKASPAVTSAQADKVERAIMAALLLIYLGRQRESLTRIGVFRGPSLTLDVRAKLRAFAHDRAQKIRTGTNTRISSALAALPDGASSQETTAALSQAHHEMGTYNRDILGAFIASWAVHQATVDTYTDNTDESGTPLIDTVQWSWQQHTDYPDECTEAMDASPAPYDELMDITGSPPPVHERCACQLEPEGI